MAIEKSSHICKTCKHFQQHYIKSEGERYAICGSGHCVYPRLKLRKSYAKACQNYAGREVEA